MIVNSDPRPLYMKVFEKLKEEIEVQHFPPGTQLPPEPQLAKSLNVSRATLREALRVLEEQHIVERIHGIGTFVKRKPIIKGGIEELNSITDMIKENGQESGTIILSYDYLEADKQDQERFQLTKGEKILLLKRIRTADEEPVIYCIDKIAAKWIPSNFEYHKQSLFEDLKEVDIIYAKSEISALSFDSEISTLLKCEPGESLLVLNQMHYDRIDRPILYSINYFRSSKFSFSVVRRRKI